MGGLNNKIWLSKTTRVTYLRFLYMLLWMGREPSLSALPLCLTSRGRSSLFSYTHVPPTSLACSNTLNWNLSGYLLRWRAQHSPAAPAPTTATFFITQFCPLSKIKHKGIKVNHNLRMRFGTWHCTDTCTLCTCGHYKQSLNANNLLHEMIGM